MSDLRYAVDSSSAPKITVNALLTTTGSAIIDIPDEMTSTLVSFAVERNGAFVSLPLSDHFDVPECRHQCRLRYTIDLSLAERSLDTAIAADDGFVTPTYAWIARPRPLPVGITRVSVDGARLALSVPGTETFVDAHAHSAALDDGFSNDNFSEGSFTAFGKLRIAPLAVPGAELDIVRIGATPKLGEPGLVNWVRDAGTCVSQLFGHFPVKHASIFVVPIRDAEEVVFGKVLSLGGPAILTLTGAELPEAKIHDDWVLVHEMMHLGAPTFTGKHRWLGEGTATYYEGLMRTRCGFKTPKMLWGEWARAMPRGLPANGVPRPLDEGTRIDDIYWGGALFLFAADVRLREKTAFTLDDVMRGILAEGGDGTVVWTIDEFVAAANRITKSDVVSQLYDAHGRGPLPIDLPKLLADLGILGKSDAVQFDERAPLAKIRHAMEAPRNL